MKVLFFMRNFSGYFRQFEPALNEMLRRGHHVHIGRDRNDSMDGHEWATEMKANYGELFTFDFTPHPQEDPWYQFKRNVRLTRDYLHFLRPEFDNSPEFTARARKRAPENVVEAFDARGMQKVPVLEACAHALYRAEDATPVNPGIERYIANHDPHIVLLTPHLMPGSLQTEYLRAAQSIGLRTGLCVASWDNLSSKQIIRLRPDVVTVWNETQRDEAVEIHHLPKERIAITGAQVYDHWFGWEARPRELFCERVGLDPARGYLLYVGGALFPAEITEAQWAAQLIERLRTCDDPRLRELGVLVRPHPKRAEEWRSVDLDRFENVAFWPNEGRMPVAAEAKADFFDSIHHSAGVVGINTSAMIEAGIVGRRVHAMLAPEFTGSQLGTLHFSYLTEVGGGLLRLSRDYGELFVQLAETVEEGHLERNPNRGFIEAFVRPQGIERPSAPLFADAIETAASYGPSSAPSPGLASRVLRRAIGGRAVSMGKEARRDWERKMAARNMTPEEERLQRSEKSEINAVERTRKAKKAAYREAAEKRKAEKAALREEKKRARADQEAERAAKLKRAETARQAAAALDPIDAARSRVRELRGSDGKVVAGPFLGDQRAELLFWIPFLNWLVAKTPGLRERLTVVGRASHRGWYEHLGADFRDEVGAMGNGLLDGAEIIAPAMVDSIARNLRERNLLAKPKKKSVFRYELLAPRGNSELVRDLPDEYVVADLAFDLSLPASETNARLVAATVERLAAAGPVVTLRRPPLEALPDDVIALDSGCAVQETAVIEAAKGFVGTLDGHAVLAPFLGVESVGIYDPGADPVTQELELATSVLAEGGLGGFRVIAADSAEPGELITGLAEAT